MFELLRALQIGLWMGVWAVGLSVAFRRRGNADGHTLARHVRGRPADLVGASLARAGGPLSLLARVAEATDDREAEIDLREQTLEAERATIRGLAALRILGLMASALGFLAVSQQISWLQADHGLLDLDPSRVGRLASERAAIALAIAVATSGSAVGIGGALRARASRALGGIRAVRDALERELPRWTASRAR